MDYCPLPFAERVDAEFAHYPGRVGVIGSDRNQSLVARMRQPWVSAATHHGLAHLEDIRGHRVHPEARIRTDDGNDLGTRREFAEGRSSAGFTGLAILDDQFDLTAEHA